MGSRHPDRRDFLKRGAAFAGGLSLGAVDPVIGRPELFTDMVSEAEAGVTRVFSVAGSDGAALRSAGTIASKLG